MKDLAERHLNDDGVEQGRGEEKKEGGSGHIDRLIWWLPAAALVIGRRGEEGSRDEAEEAACVVVGGSRGVAGWIGGKIEEEKVVDADLERGRS